MRLIRTCYVVASNDGTEWAHGVHTDDFEPPRGARPWGGAQWREGSVCQAWATGVPEQVYSDDIREELGRNDHD
jgi:hypothetical protein